MHPHDEHCDHTHHDCHGHHHHHHHHADDMKGAKLLWATFLNFSITIVQIIGGIVSNSLSLISDAIHNLGDSSATKRKRLATNVRRYWQLFSMP